MAETRSYLPARWLPESLTSRIAAVFKRADPVPVAGTTDSDATADGRPDDDGADHIGTVSNFWSAYKQTVEGPDKTRRELYAQYDAMDGDSAIVVAALDLFADTVVQADEACDVPLVITATGANKAKAQKEIDELVQRLKLGRMLWQLARDLVKYGERAEEVIIDPKFNIVRLKPLPTQRLEPQFDKFGNFKSPAFVQYDEATMEQKVAELAQFQVVWFALRKSRKDWYGTGLLWAARRAFKQLRLMEDGVVVARLTRAHNRYGIIVDGGGMTPQEKELHLQKVMRRMKKRRLLNPRTGAIDDSLHPLAIEEDIFLIGDKDSRADVKVLQGDLTVGNVDDVLMLQENIFTALRTPRWYLNSNSKETRSRAGLTPQDIQHARVSRRVQGAIIEGLRSIIELQLRLKQIANPEFTITLPKVPVVDDLKDWQTRQFKMLVARMFKQQFWPKDEWILTRILGYTDADAAEMLKGQKAPDKFNGLATLPKDGNVGASGTGGASNEPTEAEVRQAYRALPEAERRELLTELAQLEADLSAE